MKTLRVTPRDGLEHRVVEGAYLQLSAFACPSTSARFTGDRIELCRRLEQLFHGIGADTVRYRHDRQVQARRVRHDRTQPDDQSRIPGKYPRAVGDRPPISVASGEMTRCGQVIPGAWHIRRPAGTGSSLRIPAHCNLPVGTDR